MGATRPLILLVALLAACASPSHADPGDAQAREQRFDARAYERTLERIEAKRVEMSKRFAAAEGVAARDKVRARARAFVISTILDTIFPAWMGTPWGLGKNSTSTRPHQAGMTVGCSYFVTSVLLNAGLRLDNRYRFAQAPALHIQRSLAPRRADLHRFLSIPVEDLERRIAKLGDGLYLIGLNNHIGFVVVRGREVRFVHAGYTGPQTVQDESMIGAESIAGSRKAGYFVTPLFQDDRLVDKWLSGENVGFQKLGAR